MENRCIIVSGGVFSPAPEQQPGDFVIACDRGYAYCERLGLMPDLFIGDFDSYSGAVAPGVAVERLIPEKDDTDTGHAITYALAHGFRTLVLTCALGGRLDHTLANLQNAANAAVQGASVTILDEGSEINFLTHGTLRLKKRPGWGLSVFSLSDASTGVCLRGVKYELENAALDNRFPLGVSNEFDAPEAEITVEQGVLMVMQTKKAVNQSGLALTGGSSLLAPLIPSWSGSAPRGTGGCRAGNTRPLPPSESGACRFR